MDCFRSGGHAPRNEFAAPELGNSASALLGSFHPVVTILERRPGMRVQLEGQDALQIGPLARDMGREPGQDVAGRHAFGEAVEDAPPVLAEDVGEHAAHPQARAVDQLVRPVAEPRPVLGRLPPMPAQRPKLPVPLRKDQARPRQPELADPRQPHAVPDVRLATAHLLDVLRVQNQRPDARRLERVQGRLPVDPGRLHRRRRHLAARKPVRHLPEAPGRGREGPRGDLAVLPAALPDPNRRRDRQLVDVQARRAGMDDIHVVRRRFIDYHIACSLFQRG